MKKKKIVIDAGHGINTFRETGSKGIRYGNGLVFEEFEFNAAVAKLAKPLAELNGFEVVLTQPLNGRDVPLMQRTNLARNEKADLLFSIHADASADPSARGHWCFFWTGHEPSGRLALLWDKHADILMNQTLDRNYRESIAGTWTEFHMCREPVKYGIPSILMEHAFFTNAQDRELLLSSDFREKCAEVLVRAACDYFGMPFSKNKINIQRKIDVVIEGVSNTEKGYLIDGSSYLPLRKIGEHFKANVRWDNVYKQAYVNDIPVEKSYLIENISYVGLRDTAKLLGIQIDWDNKNKIAYVKGV